MTLKTEEEVKRALRRLLGKAPDETWWELAVEHGQVQDVINYDFDGEDDENEELLALLSRYREDEEYANRRLAAASDKPPRVPPRRTSDPCVQLDALSDIMALEAQSHPLVVAFRERVLGGACLQPGAVAAWLRAHDCHLWLGEPWPQPWAAARIELFAPVDLAPPENEVDFIICVVDVLRDAYGWPDPLEVAGFVLSGETPALPLAVAYVQFYDRFFPKTAKVCLEVSPQMEPERLMRLYADMRHAGMKPGTRIRPPDGAMSRLAVFAARHNDGRTWQEAWAAWAAEGGWRDDETQKHRQYDDERSFTRDARKAYRMVTGQDLEWRGGASAKPREEQP